jgi:hypothetical protein
MKIIKTHKRLTMVLIAVALTVTVFSIPVIAASPFGNNNGMHGFSSPWDDSVQGHPVGQTTYGNLAYGFDMFLIDEDYAYAFDVTDSHRSSIQRGSTTVQYGPLKGGNQDSNLEITHTQNTVYYACNY